MKTTEYILGDVCSRLSSGKSIKANLIFEEGRFPVFGGNGIRGYTESFNFDGECAIIGRQGAYCGNVQFYKGRAYMTEHAVVVCGNELSNTKFLSFVLREMDLGRLSHQAAQPGLSVKILGDLKIKLPSIEDQTKIAHILSAYDDLIENNQKQIKLLEEAAQRLYKEWFVDLRFPGYENTPVVDGVPEGWTLTNINAVMTFHRGYDLTKNSMIPGEYPVIGSTSIIGYHNQYKTKGPGIVTGRSGSLGEYQLIWEDYWPHNTALYVSDMKAHNVLYLYSMLKTVDFSGLNNGGAIPTLNRNTLSNITVIEASKALQDEYVQIVEPIYSAIRNANKQIKYLQEARDRLLPKLMNGEIEVL